MSSDEQDDATLSTTVWASFGDLMSGLVGAFVLLLMGVMAVQLDMAGLLQREIAQREAAQRETQSLERVLEVLRDYRRIIDRYPLKATYVTASALQILAMVALAMGNGYVALLGAIASLSAVGLLAVSAWLISKASEMPPVLDLSLAALFVRDERLTPGAVGSAVLVFGGVALVVLR